MFAVVDVETTGGHASRHRMTEVAVVVHNGLKIVDEYRQLINPQRSIPLNIQALTGITPEMTAGAPKFSKLAEELRAVLADHIFVAHNVNFDLSFIQREFAECGIKYRPRRLCSVRYARRLAPGLKSYALRSLCHYFKVNNEAAHRAWGDARATAEILGYLFERDKQGQWQQMIKHNQGELNLPAHLPAERFHRLPEAPGVYYLLDQQGRVLYVGKARNIKKRIASHFGSDKESSRAQAFKRLIYDLSYRLTGGTLVAGLLEDHEIRRLWPPYNRAQKKPRRKYGVFLCRNLQGADTLVINQLGKQFGHLREFSNLAQAQSWVARMIEEYHLNPRYCGFPAHENGASISDHNRNLARLVEALKERQESLIIKTSGRAKGEDGFVWIQDLQVKGYGFISHNDPEPDFQSALQPLQHSITSQNLIARALEDPGLEVVEAPARLSLPPVGLLF